ncbi:MAG: DUF5107 domain-containing protein, partial [Planctomycetota bacterium]
TDHAASKPPFRTHATPGLAMVRYHLAHVLRRTGSGERAKRECEMAASMRRDLCFPNRLDDIDVLRAAIAEHPTDALAPFALGNLLYDKKQRDLAIACWRESIARDLSFPTSRRNLGIALVAEGEEGEAWAMFESAFALDQSDARVLYELDQLAKRLRHSPAERLLRLEQHTGLVATRDDLSIERVSILNAIGRHRDALREVLGRAFRPWEGGEGRVPAQFVFAVNRLAEQMLEDGAFQEAFDLLSTTDSWPKSLGEGKLPGIQENDINYLKGRAMRGLGDEAAARHFFTLASSGLSEPSSQMYYNDQPPEMIYYQGLALLELDRKTEATERFMRLVEYGREHLEDEVEVDYFAVSLPDFLIFEPDIRAKHRAHCKLMSAFGLAGLGDSASAQRLLREVLESDPSHVWAASLMHAAGRGGRQIIELQPVASRSAVNASGG